MNSHNIVLMPVLLPLLTGIILIFFRNIKVQRIISLLSFIVGIGLSLYLVTAVHTNGILTLDVSSWNAPFGITIAADMLASILVLTTNVIGFSSLIYSFRSIGTGRESYYYYTVFQLLIVGVNGAFLTGDIFNLFVFFEVMLMSSYVLLVLGGTKIQLRETIKYILVNVISSAIFVIAVAYLYSVVGTLNMADLSRKIAEIGQPGIITVIAVLFLFVFGLKGAVFPLFFWLPGSYYAAPAPVLALFGALLTKVGIYSIFRTYTLLFYHDIDYTHALLGGIGLLTIIIGVIGAVAYWDVKKIIIYNIIIAVGVLAFGISLSNETGTTGTILYLVHDMIIKAALFLLVGLMARIAGTSDLRKMGGFIKDYPLVGWTFFVAAISLAGIPPLSGFAGKLMILQGAAEAKAYFGMFIILASSLFVLYSVMKIFINGFWGAPIKTEAVPSKSMITLLGPAILLVAISLAFGLGVEKILPYISQATETLMNPDIYINAVIKE
ncbi:Na+/H+ antiporter subunit D [Bacillus massiliigorillae]|uniref:Na+/H+ antiporter subunit D n=1 Tax=Bacillus massiliigorillae TaxID=1243664 RepID=UPI000399EC36|nr:Na+/H+ antiporter subunit D [Bacillus massiliigorillae]